MAHIDSLGVEIILTDVVYVNGWGDGARLVDTGIRTSVQRFNRKRVVILDSDGQPRAVSPSNLAVMRRDGYQGFEGNRRA